MKSLALILLLTGCAGNWTQMDCSNPRSVSPITWDVTADPYATCKALGVETLVRDGACVSVAGDKATIHAEAPAEIDDQFLGHEVKHAFGCKHS